MPKFKVTGQDTVHYEMIVEAESKEEVRKMWENNEIGINRDPTELTISHHTEHIETIESVEKDKVFTAMNKCEKIVIQLIKVIGQCMKEGCTEKATKLTTGIGVEIGVYCESDAFKAAHNNNPLGVIQCITCGTFGATNNEGKVTDRTQGE